MFRANPNIKGITLWGYVFGQTRMANTAFIQDMARLAPAMSWIQSFLGR